jgi:tetratricopeptide (TPR) repeat protein
MTSKLVLLLRILYNPVGAMAEIKARSPYLVSGILATASTFIYFGLVNGNLAAVIDAFRYPASPGLVAGLINRCIGAAAPVLFLAGLFVPACILAVSLVGRNGSFAYLLRLDYAGLTSCVCYSWAVSHLVMLIPDWFLLRSGHLNQNPGWPAAQLAIWLAPLPYFMFLVGLALKVIFKLSLPKTGGILALSSLSLIGIVLIPNLLFLISSPFVLLLLIIILRNVLGDVFSSQRDRERFRRGLETATLNPADASAHYNLGLIYEQHGQLEEAKICYQRAIEIAPDEVDAHYRLGRIAREQAQLAEAIRFFDTVVAQEPSHSQNEVWREVGLTYFQAGQYEDAREALERFLQSRPTDAEGHYYYGLALHKLGRSDEAANEMRAVIDVVRTAPAYKYRLEKHWMNEAQSFLRSQS